MEKKALVKNILNITYFYRPLQENPFNPKEARDVAYQ